MSYLRSDCSRIIKGANCTGVLNGLSIQRLDCIEQCLREEMNRGGRNLAVGWKQGSEKQGVGYCQQFEVLWDAGSFLVTLAV